MLQFTLFRGCCIKAQNILHNTHKVALCKKFFTVCAQLLNCKSGSEHFGSTFQHNIFEGNAGEQNLLCKLQMEKWSRMT